MGGIKSYRRMKCMQGWPRLTLKLIIEQMFVLNPLTRWPSMHRHMVEFGTTESVSPHFTTAMVATSHTQLFIFELLLHRWRPLMKTQAFKLVTMLPLARKCVYRVVDIFFFIILNIIILVINLNPIILPNKRSIRTTLRDAFIYYPFVLTTVGLIDN